MREIMELVYKIIQQNEYIDIAFKAGQDTIPLVYERHKMHEELSILVRHNKGRVREVLNDLIHDIENGYANGYHTKVYQELYTSYIKLS